MENRAINNAEVKRPRVSIWMSAYNHETYVEQAILSIVNQTYQDFELLVVDDGSSDRTPVILKRLSEKYGFYFEQQENMGLPKTLNKLIAMAKGEYITGCASDDYWPLDRLELQVAHMDENPQCDILQGMAQIVGKDEKFIKPYDKLIYGEKPFDKLLSGKYTFSAITCIYRKNVFEKVGLYDENIETEDVDFMIRASLECTFDKINKVFVHYRQHPDSWSRSSKMAGSIVRSNLKVANKLNLKNKTRYLIRRSNYIYSKMRQSHDKRWIIFLLLKIVNKVV